MKRFRPARVLLALAGLLVAAYVALAIALSFRSDAIAVYEGPVAGDVSLVIFGASGTAGDGILKAALESPDVRHIQVITRRATPRIEEGVASGKVQMTLHSDYLNYTALSEQITSADAVYWALGTSSLGVDESTYGRIHVDFPAHFVASWIDVSDKPGIAFHYISSSDISADSKAMWAREKFRAEQTLTALATGTRLRVILYRPDYIGPTDREAHLGQDLLYAFFAPLGAAVKAEQIGQAMLEVSARGEEFQNGARLNTRRIIQHSDAYERRRSP